MLYYNINVLYKIASLWNQLVKFQPIFNLTDFHYSRPVNEIYVAIFNMYPSFIFRPGILYDDYEINWETQMHHNPLLLEDGSFTTVMNLVGDEAITTLQRKADVKINT